MKRSLREVLIPSRIGTTPQGFRNIALGGVASFVLRRRVPLIFTAPVPFSLFATNQLCQWTQLEAQLYTYGVHGHWWL